MLHINLPTVFALCSQGRSMHWRCSTTYPWSLPYALSNLLIYSMNYLGYGSLPSFSKEMRLLQLQRFKFSVVSLEIAGKSRDPLELLSLGGTACWTAGERSIAAQRGRFEERCSGPRGAPHPARPCSEGWHCPGVSAQGDPSRGCPTDPSECSG